MNRSVYRWLGFALILTTGTAAAVLHGESFPLRYKLLKDETSPEDPEFVFRWVNSQSMSMRIRNGTISENEGKTKTFASLVKNEPANYRCPYPFRGTARIGLMEFAFVLDASRLEAEGYDLCYFDLNHNGDLTDDGVMSARPAEDRRNWGSRSTERSFPRLEISHNDGTNDYPIAFFLSVRTRRQQDDTGDMRVYVDFSAANYRTGTVKLDNKKWDIVLLDFNSNGRFDDAYRINVNQDTDASDRTIYFHTADIIMVNPNDEDYSSPWYLTARDDQWPVAKWIRFADRYYDLAITPSGESITLTPSSVPIGSVTNANESFQAILYNQEDFIKIAGNKKTPALVPIGRWQLASYHITRESTARRRRRASASEEDEPSLVYARATRDYPPITVREGQSSELPFGPPYKPLVKVANQRKGTAELALTIVGSVGEIVNNIEIKGKRPPEPSFRIKTTAGKTVTSGQFEYG